jgi:opacity protein-like surface antigen
MTGHLELSGGKVIYDISNINNDVITPYQFYIATGVSYTMVKNLSLSLDYKYTTYRQSIDSATNNTEINSVLLGVKKVF